MINNSTASLKDVDDGQADEPANIPEATESNKELEKEWQERSESSELRSKKARVKPQAETLTDWQTRHAWLYEQGEKMFPRTCLKHDKKNSMSEGASYLRALTFNRHAESRDHKEAIITDKVQSKNLAYMAELSCSYVDGNNKELSFDMKKDCKVDSKLSVNFTKCLIPIV